MLRINPAIPKAAMAKVGTCIEYCIFAHIKMMKAILNPKAHLPDVDLGINMNFISLTTQGFARNQIENS